jgi:hypothetical protein
MFTWKSFSRILAAVGLFAFVQTSAAEAHLTSLRATLVPVLGGPSPIVLDPQSLTKLTLIARKGGLLSLSLRNATNAVGQKIDAANNTLRLHVFINGAPQTLDFPFTISNGRAAIKREQLGLVKPDLVEIADVLLLDENGVAFGTLGFHILEGL